MEVLISYILYNHFYVLEEVIVYNELIIKLIFFKVIVFYHFLINDKYLNNILILDNVGNHLDPSYHLYQFR